jgi:hypothetical protein
VGCVASAFYLPISAFFLWAFFNAYVTFLAVLPIVLSLGLCFIFLMTIVIPELESAEGTGNSAGEDASPAWRHIWLRRLLIGIFTLQAIMLLSVIALTTHLVSFGLAQSDQRLWSILIVGAQVAVLFIPILLQSLWSLWRLIAAIPHSFY